MIFLLFFMVLIFATTFIKAKARKVTLVNDEGHTIVLQGTYHIADKLFYQSIFSDLDHYRRNGFKILYERVISENPSKHKTRNFLSKKRACYFSKILKSDSQHRYINQYQDSDIRADVYLEDALKHVSFVSSDKQDVLSLFKLYKFVDKFKLNFFIRYLLNVLFSIHNFKESLDKKENNNFIIGTRNKIVLNHIYIDNLKDAYIHYGEAHITDLILRLKKLNYRVVSCEYLTPFP